MRIAAYLCVFMAALLWGLLGPIAKFALRDGVAPLEVAFWRAAFGALFFAAHCAIARQIKIRPKDAPALLGFGVIGVGVFFGSYQVAVKEGGAALASILLYTAPAWVALLSRIIFAEPLRPGKILALVVAMAGAFLVSLGSNPGGLGAGQGLALGIACGLLSGFTYATHYIFGRRYLRDYSSAVIYCYCMPVGALCLLPFVEFTPKPGSAWLVFIALGLVCTYGAYMFYCMGLKRLSATRVAVTANLEPVTAAILAFLWWDEVFKPIGYLGGALVITGVIIMVLEGARASRSPKG